MADDLLLDDLNDRQREAVVATTVPLAIFAGAGSGKTRVLTRRIAWLTRERHVDPRHVLAVTFTRKAAGELSGRLRQLGVRDQVTAGTFHALALAQVRRRRLDRGEAVPAVLERKVRLLVPLIGGGRNVGQAAADLAGEIEWAKARLVAPDHYAAAVTLAGRTPKRDPHEIAALYARYEELKRRRGVVDFDDLIWEAADALMHDTEFAAAIRWRFRHMFVDEFQDVSPAQFRLLSAWLGGRPDLCVVGDDDQAIYSFTGADAGYLVAFRRHFPGATVVRLEVNYRSTPEILRAAAAVLPRRERVKRLPTAAGASGPLPTVTSYATDADEARGVARALRSLHGPDRPWRAMAVLYRINAQSVRFEEALRAAGIPFRVRGGARFLDRPEIVGALEQLRASERRAPGLPFAAHLSDLAAHGRGDDDGDVATDDPDDDRQAVRRELVRLGHEYLAAEGPPGSFDGFRGYLASVFADDLAPPGDAVELLSFHRAKGLEWPAVFVTGLERGLVPIAYADTPAALSEERRLVYVAMSRAASDLRLSWAQRRTLGDRDTPRRPSPYLIPINAVLTGQPSETPPRRRPRAGLAAARAAGGLGPAGDADPTVLSALVEWRRGLARVNGIPAFVIFHDATLAAVAEAKPRNHRDLLALPGIGPVKVERYGDAVLDVVRRHAS